MYCDFYFEIGKSRAGFETGILQEWNARKSHWPDKPQTLYFGGGTPSLLEPDQIQTLVQTLAPDAQEITLEANPEDLTPEYLRKIKQAGVNRLSLGVQSLEDSVLKYLGRKHRTEQAKGAILDAQEAGFERISVDLIVGVSGEQWEPAVTWLREQNIGHLSVYLLTVETMTPLDRLIKKGRLQAPCEDQQADSYIRIQEALSGLGYEQYEVSSYALAGHESQHNRIYWSKGEYLGLGPGAHSMCLSSAGFVTRRHTHAQLAEWLRAPAQPPFQEEYLAPQDALLEALAFGMRDLQAGVDPGALAARHQTTVPTGFEALMQRFIRQNWVQKESICYHITGLGARFADAIAREILGLEQ